MTHRFHVGRKTTGFDVLAGNLIVVEHQEGVSGGRVIHLDAAGGADQTPVASRGKPASGHRAYAAQDGGLYEVHGIELRPVAVKRYVRFSAQDGFAEVAAGELGGALAAQLKELSGTPDQVEWAGRLRTQAVLALVEAGRPDLLARAGWRTFAGWWIKHRSVRGQAWIDVFEALSQRASGAESAAPGHGHEDGEET